MMIINKLSGSLRELHARFKLWRKPKKDCHYCCLFCDYFEACEAELYGGKTIEHRGYTIKQSGLNYHTAIYDDSGCIVFCEAVTKPLTIAELKAHIDLYLDTHSGGHFEKSLENQHEKPPRQDAPSIKRLETLVGCTTEELSEYIKYNSICCGATLGESIEQLLDVYGGHKDEEGTNEN